MGALCSLFLCLWKVLQGEPRRCKLSIGTDGLMFNKNIQMDTMFIYGRPFSHIVDDANHLYDAAFLRKQSTSNIL